MAYLAPIATIIVALVAACASYLARRDERADALKEVELMERLHGLAKASHEFELATNALSRRLERWESRDRDRLLSGAGWLMLGGVLAWAIFQLIFVSTFGAEADKSSAWRLFLNGTAAVALVVACLGGFAVVLHTAISIGVSARRRYLTRKLEAPEPLVATRADLLSPAAGPQPDLDPAGAGEQKGKPDSGQVGQAAEEFVSS